MSIYGTLAEWRIGERTVFFQGVPEWVDFEADWLPPPVPESERDDPSGVIKNRVIVVVDDLTDKGGNGYGGQQYHRELMRLTDTEYDEWMATKQSRDRLRYRLRRALVTPSRDDAHDADSSRSDANIQTPNPATPP